MDFILIDALRETEKLLTSQMQQLLQEKGADIVEDLKEEADWKQYSELYRNREQVRSYITRHDSLLNEYLKFHRHNIA